MTIPLSIEQITNAINRFNRLQSADRQGSHNKKISLDRGLGPWPGERSSQHKKASGRGIFPFPPKGEQNARSEGSNKEESQNAEECRMKTDKLISAIAWMSFGACVGFFIAGALVTIFIISLL